SSIGSANGLGTPKLASEGPIPRTRLRLGSPPVIMNPATATLASVKTCKRVERLIAWAGEAVGAGVSVGVGVCPPGVDVGVADPVGVGVGVPGVGVGPVGVTGKSRIPV